MFIFVEDFIKYLCKIKCKECSQMHIGETGRSFKLRIGEHKKQLQRL